MRVTGMIGGHLFQNGLRTRTIRHRLSRLRGRERRLDDAEVPVFGIHANAEPDGVRQVEPIRVA